MMRNKWSYFIRILSILTIVACSDEKNSAEIEKSKEILVYPSNYAKRSYTDSLGWEITEIDSLQYKITWKRNKDDFRIKHSVDTLAKIDSFYTYLADTITGYGLRTYPNNAEIGKWKMKTPTGKDTIVDHDAEWDCNYFEALKVASQQGFNLSNSEVFESNTRTPQSNSNSWIFMKTDLPENADSGEPHHILIYNSECQFTLYDIKQRPISRNQVFY